MDGTLHGARRLDGSYGGRCRSGPRPLRIAPQEVALEPVSHLLDRLAVKDGRHPYHLVDEVVHEVVYVPLGARSRCIPLIVPNRMHPATKGIAGPAEQFSDVLGHSHA